MAEEALPIRPTKSPDLVEGDPYSVLDVKNGEEDQLETSGSEQPTRLSTPDTQDSAFPEDPRADESSQLYRLLRPFRVFPSFHKRTDLMRIAVKGYNCSPSYFKYMKQERDITLCERDFATDATAQLQDRELPEVWPMQPAAEVTGPSGQDEKPVPGDGDMQLSTANKSSGARPTLRRWASWPPMHSVPWSTQPIVAWRAAENGRVWLKMEERAYQG